MKLYLLSVAASIVSVADALEGSIQNPYSQWYKHSQRKGLEVDLGYEKYVGEANATTGVSFWKGYVSPSPFLGGDDFEMLKELCSIRFAAPPTGVNRFQAPKVPAVNRSEVLPANNYQTECIQGSGSVVHREAPLFRCGSLLN